VLPSHFKPGNGQRIRNHQQYDSSKRKGQCAIEAVAGAAIKRYTTAAATCRPARRQQRLPLQEIAFGTSYEWRNRHCSFPD
jgi:hypothetical protein